MAGMVYKWKPGSRIKVAPDVAGAELERIRRESGDAFTPNAVVEAARRRGTPLHDYFDWDDKTAAAAYRVDQARYLIRHIVVCRDDEPVEEAVRVYASITEDESGPTYTTTRRAMENVEWREQLLRSAERDMEAFQARYRKLTELADVLDAMARARKRPRRRSDGASAALAA
jgi:hypothetical protein